MLNPAGRLPEGSLDLVPHVGETLCPRASVQAGVCVCVCVYVCVCV